MGAAATAATALPPPLCLHVMRNAALVSANQDLRLLYGPHGREVPSVAIQLTGFIAPDAAQAEKVLLEYGAAYLFNLGKATGVSLRLRRSEYRLGSRRRQAYSGKVRFPQQGYDVHPAELYTRSTSSRTNSRWRDERSICPTGEACSAE